MDLPTGGAYEYDIGPALGSGSGAIGVLNEIPIPPYSYGNSDPVDRIDPSGHLVETAEIEGTTTTSGLEQFIKALAAAGLAYCTTYQENCVPIYRGRIHAQGKTFGGNAGTGVSETWVQEVSPPSFQGFSMLGERVPSAPKPPQPQKPPKPNEPGGSA